MDVAGSSERCYPSGQITQRHITELDSTVIPPYSLVHYPRFTAAWIRIWKLKKRFISFKTRPKRERAVTWWNPAAQTRPVFNSSSFAPRPPYSRFPAELASILLVPFLLFPLVVALSHCLCSESHYLSIKRYRIYVCYTNITLYIAFGNILERITRGYGGTPVMTVHPLRAGLHEASREARQVKK
jgi:hypothetical protein